MDFLFSFFIFQNIFLEKPESSKFDNSGLINVSRVVVPPAKKKIKHWICLTKYVKTPECFCHKNVA